MQIRMATSNDQDAVRSVHWSAFAEYEREVVSNLAVNLLSEETTPKTFSLVAETGDVVVGHVAFSPVTSSTNENFLGYILAPLGVKPGCQKRRVGSKLIENGMRQLTTMDVEILFVYGDPKYYSKFGFSVDVAKYFIPPYELQYPFGWQGATLNECSTGTSAKISCVTSLCDPTLW